MAPVPPRCKYPLEFWMLAYPVATVAPLNTRFANNGNNGMGYGPTVFSVPLSQSGNLPAQAYHAHGALLLEDISQFTYLVAQSALSKCWVWLRSRDEVQHYFIAQLKAQLDSEFNAAEFKRLDWMGRTNMYVHLTETVPIDSQQALNWLATNSTPTIDLQPITAT